MEKAIAKFVDENPMKVYAGIFVTADLLFAMNIFAGAGILWVTGAALGILAHTNKAINGKGAYPKDASVYDVRLSDLTKTFSDVIQYAAKVFHIEYWKEVFAVITQSKPSFFAEKVIRCHQFSKYPLDVGWLLISCAGILYMLDSSNIFGFREEASILQFITGLVVFFAAFVAFLTDRNDLAGSIFAIATLSTMAAGIVGMNLPLFLAACIFLYGNYLQGKVVSKAQSSYTISKTKKKAASKTTGVNS